MVTAITPEDTIELERWEKAKEKLSANIPMWETYCIHLDLETQNTWVPTAATDGKKIFVNTNFSKGKTDEEITFILAHEIFHVAAGHIWRGADYFKGLDNKELKKARFQWNVATDYAIHQVLKPWSEENNPHPMSMPIEALYDPRFDNMSAEDILKFLQENPDDPANVQQPQTVHIFVGKGDLSDAPSGAKGDGKGNWVIAINGDGEPVDLDEALENGDVIPDLAMDQQDLKDLVKEATEAYKSLREKEESGDSNSSKGSPTGSSHGNIQVNVKPVTTPWSALLAQFCIKAAKTDYSWKRPNRRALSAGYMAPGLKSDLLRGVIAIDTSGSIDENLLEHFISELASIRGQIPAHELHIIYCDTQVQRVDYLMQGQKLKTNVPTGGGTCFAPVFNHVEKMGGSKDFLIFFTDGENSDAHILKKMNPAYPVLWAIYGSGVDQPFGQVLKMKR